MGFFNIFDIAASGMSAQRIRMNVISSNLANADTTRTPEGGPYRRKDVVFVSDPLDGTAKSFGDFLRCAVFGAGKQAQGVRVMEIVEDKKPFRKVYDPYHPDADKDGYVLYPNVDVVEEMVNLISASRSFEANVTAFNSAKDMVLKLLEMGRV